MTHETIVPGRAAADVGLPPALGVVEAVDVLAGGSIATTRRVRCSDGTVVVKDTPYDATLEAEGLCALGEAGHPVPEVHAATTARLVTSDVSGPSDWAGLGARVAAAHLRPARPDGNDIDTARYGWHRDNVLGSLPQDNTPDVHWGRFVAERRVRPFLGAGALPPDVRRRCEDACDGPLVDLLGPGAGPTVVHGDLWTGNVVDGRALVDPAVFRGDREYDVAYLQLYGTPPRAFWEAYEAAAPLADGWQRRVGVVHLTSHLVHVAHFGAGYVASVVADLDALGW